MVFFSRIEGEFIIILIKYFILQIFQIGTPIQLNLFLLEYHSYYKNLIQFNCFMKLLKVVFIHENYTSDKNR